MPIIGPRIPCNVADCGKPLRSRGVCGFHEGQLKALGWWQKVNQDATRLCIVETCERTAHRRSGYCDVHHMRVARHGDPSYESVIIGDDVRRFFSKIEKAAGEDACWLWTGGLTRQGYPVYATKAGSAVRWAYEHFIGPIPSLIDGEPCTVDHLCHTNDLTCVGGPMCLHRRCVNPYHIELVTGRENTRRGRGTTKARRQFRADLLKEGN